MDRANERRDVVNENITLSQKADGLTFGTDAYLLSAFVRPRPKAIAVDLGSGTGIIPLLCLTRDKYASCTAVEIQPAFGDLIRRNAEENHLAHRLSLWCGDLRELTAAKLGCEVDIVTANPPYMTQHSGAANLHEEKYIARHEIHGGIFDFCAAAGRILKHGGRFYCVFRPDRLSDLMAAMREARLEPKRMTFVHATYAATPSMVLVEATKGAAPSLTVTPPLCLWEADKTHPAKPAVPMIPTADSEYIYEHCAFPTAFLGTNKQG